MSLNLIYPNAVTQREIAQDLIRNMTADDLTLKLLPVQNEDTHFVRWFQMDNYYGIMGMRGLDGSPSLVREVGTSSYTYQPGVYGEFMQIGETEILTRASPMNMNLPIRLTDLVSMRQKQLIGRAYDRMRYNIWQLLGTGTLNIPLNGPAGAIYQDTYSIQTYVAPIPWSSTTTATPILNSQYIQQLQVGHSVDFGASAIQYMNQITANQMIGATLNNLPDIANYFKSQNLPAPTIFDDGYQPYPVQGPITNAVQQFIKFIPNGLSIVIGKRTNGDPIGHFKKTIQAMQPGGGMTSGDYNFVKDYAQGINAPLEVPPRLEVHYGYNGGPVLELPSSVVAFTAG